MFSAFCTPTSNINKEKFLIIWTLIGPEIKQAQLVEFWKNVPTAVLYEHRYSIFYIMKINYTLLLLRLKCTFSNKPTPVTAINQSNELNPIRPPAPISSDPSIIEMQKLVNNIFFFLKYFNLKYILFF